MKELKLVAAILLGVSFICLAVAGYLSYSTQNFINRSEEAPGVVVDMGRRSSGSSTLYYPVVEFTTRNEETITWHSRAGSNPASFRTGEKVGMYYDPADPQKARIATFFQLWGAVLIVTAVAIFFGLLGGVFAFAASRFRAG